MIAVRPKNAISNRKYWTHETLRDPADLTGELLKCLFHGEVSGIRIPGFMPVGDCEAALCMIKAQAAEAEARYKGIEADLATKTGIASHWEFRYCGSEWADYFPKVEAANIARKRLFATSWGDPVEQVTEMLQAAWPHRVGIANHPTLLKPLYAGLIRSGVPKLHIDWARFDMPGLDVVMQAGWSIYLQNPGPGGDLACYRVLGMEAGLTAEEARMIGGPIGNYGLSRELINGVETDTIPAKAGDLVFAPNRFLHEVTPAEHPEQRISIAAHVAWMGDGTLGQFS